MNFWQGGHFKPKCFSPERMLSTAPPSRSHSPRGDGERVWRFGGAGRSWAAGLRFPNKPAASSPPSPSWMLSSRPQDGLGSDGEGWGPISQPERRRDLRQPTGPHGELPCGEVWGSSMKTCCHVVFT